MSAFKAILPSVHSLEKYEEFKQNIGMLEAAKEIVHRHQLPPRALMLFPEGTNIVFSQRIRIQH